RFSPQQGHTFAARLNAECRELGRLARQKVAFFSPCSSAFSGVLFLIFDI
ncbi:unnamed protein product, partial [Larinioides sclopetarius]